MPLLVLWIIAAVLVVWLVREIAHQRRRRAFLATRDTRGRPLVPPHQRVADDELRQRAHDLRRAVERGLITRDEAVGSLVRLGGAAVSPERARRLLSGE
jgi:hypothetical protein